jgi:hypothetical protein
MCCRRVVRRVGKWSGWFVVMTERRRPHMRFPSHKEGCRYRIQQTAASSEGDVDMARGWRRRGCRRGWAGDEESLRRRFGVGESVKSRRRRSH